MLFYPYSSGTPKLFSKFAFPKKVYYMVSLSSSQKEHLSVVCSPIL